MTLIINTSRDVEMGIEQQARTQGVALNACVHQLLERHAMPAGQRGSLEAEAMMEERLQLIREGPQQLAIVAPGISHGALRREGIYG